MYFYSVKVAHDCGESCICNEILMSAACPDEGSVELMWCWFVSHLPLRTQALTAHSFSLLHVYPDLIVIWAGKTRSQSVIESMHPNMNESVYTTAVWCDEQENGCLTLSDCTVDTAHRCVHMRFSWGFRSYGLFLRARLVAVCTFGS